ncbi:MAG: hypothetical protein RBS34_16315 [Desulfofustis sp.]|jgi:hypothetical protein|nr:hypothetical protein [Desulfofustis sp.]
MSSRAQQLYVAVFNVPGAARRGPAFRLGALRAMENCEVRDSTLVVDRDCPYPDETNGRDAWLAGYESGLTWWRRNEQAGMVAGADERM